MNFRINALLAALAASASIAVAAQPTRPNIVYIDVDRNQRDEGACPCTYVQPDVQYIIQPGGTGSIPNALVLGMQIGVTF